MKKYLLILFVLCVAISSIILVKQFYISKSHLPIPQKIKPQTQVKHSSHLFDPAFFSQAYDLGKQYEKVANEKILGGIIPHHLLAAPLIAGFFEGIGNQKIDTVILLSPNHYGVGPYDITTSKGVWTTIFGDLNTDISKVSALETNKAAFVSEGLFDNEHGIYGITPFIKKTFPNAKMVPIVIKGGTSKKECDKLVQALNKIANDHTLILVSSDFSHYLSLEQADIHDKESIPAIETFNADKVLGLDPVKNIDSPQSVYILLKVMQLKKATQPIFLVNSNSAKLTNQPNLQNTTSYLTMYFTSSGSQLPINTIFNYSNPDQIDSRSKPGEYTIIATGDVIPARSVNAKLVQLNDFNYEFEKTASFLKKADAVFINLESPLIPNCKPTIEGMIFCGDTRDVQGLTYAGITVASIANNHAGNYGIDGINSTLNLLNQNHIYTTGNGSAAIITIRDKKFGFLGYNDIGHEEPGIAWANTEQVQKDVQALKNRVNFVIVTFHWGAEYTLTPDSTQIDLAHAAIDAGADLIIGNHPHWVQGIEQYKGKFITYAHGNFVFDQMWSQETREGVLGKYTFSKNGLIDVKFYPIIIDNYAQPRFANEDEANAILNRMKESSLEIASSSASFRQ